MTPDQIFSLQMELTELRNKVTRQAQLGNSSDKMDELVQVLADKVGLFIF